MGVVQPEENSEYIQAQIQDATLLKFEKCGHAPHIEDAEKFNESLIGFLERNLE